MKANVIRGYRLNATDSKSVELRFMSVRVGLGVPFTQYHMKFYKPSDI